ncbi:MAG: monofunctional biosynthetic peptidoglycan transglycosylase [Bauldia sp.]|nr:monofunctional biosynthetic peptidoglycan transglycosylase [Bauldia sp.]
MVGNRTAEARRTRLRKPAPRRKAWRRIVRWTLVVVAVIVAIPLLVVPLYRVAAPVSTLMLWDRITGGEVDRRWVTLDEVSPTLVRAVVASEDNFFCRHHGVDWGEVREVLATGADRGASTIAMQTARNLFLWQGRSFVRKGLEVPIALYADLVLGKRRMMEIYLNIAEWGPGIFGIEAAAQHHFGVSAVALTPRQAVLLAITLPGPLSRDPAAPSASMERVAAIIADRVAAGPDVSCLGL